MLVDLERLLDKHLPRISQGKVRNGYALARDEKGPLRLMWVSDRVSIFDFKLGFPVPGKGAILNAFNISARIFLHRNMLELKQDVIAFGIGIDRYLPKELRGNPELQRTSVIVRPHQMGGVEAVVRQYLTGTGYKAYARGQLVCGHAIGPTGQPEGFRLSESLFTPTTKAARGHDEPLNYREVRRTHPGLEDLSLGIYGLLAEYSTKRGVIGADTKFEFSQGLVLCDEVWTPDSSRFWDSAEYKTKFPGCLPNPLDKQELREWGKKQGIDKLNPEDREHVRSVLGLRAPPEVIKHYIEQMNLAFLKIWGGTIESFQHFTMGIR